MAGVGAALALLLALSAVLGPGTAAAAASGRPTRSLLARPTSIGVPVPGAPPPTPSAGGAQPSSPAPPPSPEAAPPAAAPAPSPEAPAAAPSPAPAPSPEPAITARPPSNCTYTVQSGDTLSAISQARGFPLEAVVAANPQIANPDLIRPGEVINLPSCPTISSSPSPAPSPEAARPAVTTTAPGGGGDLSGGGCPDRQAVLDAHNGERAQTGAQPLTWSADLANKAQAAAEGCRLQPSGSGYGENQAAGTGWKTCAAALPLWAGGKSQYSAGAGQPPEAALAWTQIVWKGTSQVGCGLADCPDGGHVVCFYQAPGNVQGQFQQNV